MASRRTRYKGGSGERFGALPYHIFTSPQYAALSARAVKALIDLVMQYRGSNNGDLCAGWAVMRKSGWTSKDQLKKALHELEQLGWILRTRQGDIDKPTLYAVTFRGIDRCDGKLDVGMVDPKPRHYWKFPQALAEELASRRRVTRTVLPAIRGSLPRDTGEKSDLSERTSPVSRVEEAPESPQTSPVLRAPL